MRTIDILGQAYSVPDPLDIEVAEKVMGFIQVEPSPAGTPRWKNQHGIMYWPADIPFYSGDIESAWRIVKHLEKHGWLIDLSCRDSVNGRYYECQFGHNSHDATKIHCYLDECKAICYAAIEAAGIMKK